MGLYGVIWGCMVVYGDAWSQEGICGPRKGCDVKQLLVTWGGVWS